MAVTYCKVMIGDSVRLYVLGLITGWVACFMHLLNVFKFSSYPVIVPGMASVRKI